MDGEIDMDLDGTVIHLKAGDVMVQRGTIHNWINTGTKSCILAVILIDAKPVTAAARCSTRWDENLGSPQRKAPL